MATAPILAVVTGGNKGIGLEICRALASKPGVVCILTARDTARGRAARDALVAEGTPGNQLLFRQLDVCDGASVRDFAEWLATDPQSPAQGVGAGGAAGLNVLVSNAAIAFKAADPTPFAGQARPTIATNVFGAWAVVDALLPLLRAAGAVPQGFGARVVSVASQAGSGALARMAPALRQRIVPGRDAASNVDAASLLRLAETFVADVEAGRHADRGWPNTCYGTSKALLIGLTRALDRAEATVRCESCCPGYCCTDMSSRRGPRSPAKGAETPVWLALSERSGAGGGFFYDKSELPLG
jgi:carbonyl reductase 1